MIEINISNTYSSTIELNDELINQGSLRANEFFITAEFAKTYEELTRYVCTFNFRRNDSVEINGLVATPVYRNSKWGWYYTISSKDITALDGDLHLTIKLNNLNEEEVITTASFTLHVEHNAIGEEQVLINDAQYNALLDKFNLYYTKDAIDNLVFDDFDIAITDKEVNIHFKDGSPKGVYANLSALQTAFPSGASGVYLTSDNGHWYYWNGSAWTDGGVYQSSEDIEKIKEDLTQFKNGTFDIESHTSTNLLDPSKVTKGYFYWTNGENESASYNHTDFIPVESGDVLSFQWGNKDSALGREIYDMKFVVGLDADKNIVASSCLRDQTTYTVPIGIKFVVISTVKDLTSVADDNAMSVVKSSVVIDWESYDNSYEKYTLKDSASNDNHINSLIDAKINRSVSKHTIIGDSDSLENGTVIKLSDHLDVKKNKIYRFYGKFTTFNSVTIGHGYNVYGGSWVTIDNTNITAYYYNGSSAVQMGQWSHGLTISDFIDVIINVGDVQNLRASVTVMSVGGDFSQTNIPMGGCNGQIFAFGTQAMTDVKYSVSLNDMTSDVWLFGDSYISLGDPNRWTYQLMQYGYKGLLMCGFSGASSNNEILAFRELTEIGKPKYIVWALGMNDADKNGSVNTDWKSAYDEVKKWCNNNYVELIACTIPNTPRVRNVEKNNIVRSSGLRYVDFAKAVNAEEDGATWYPNMLSSDNVHPIHLGAKVLANRFLVDVPEVIN